VLFGDDGAALCEACRMRLEWASTFGFRGLKTLPVICENNSKTSGTHNDSKITVLSCPMQLTIASLTS
jgi:hypothetical protein